MSRKRRMFDIDLPDGEIATPPAADKAPRRSPMASAIAENADAVQARQSAAATIRAENDALAHEYVAAREAGQVIQRIPLDDIHTELLVRDRMPGEDEELADLMTSLKDIGLSNPIRVAPRAAGGFELVQGLRRLTAFRTLLQDTGDDAWGAIPALLLTDEAEIDTLYRQMVDENIVRKDLSYIEMAEVARTYAADPETPATTTDEAVKLLFKSASYAKRSHIRSFARLLDLIGPLLKYPTEMPRNLGLSVLKQLEDVPARRKEIAKALDGWDNRSIEDELQVLRQVAQSDRMDDDAPAAPASGRKGAGDTAAADPKKAKTTFDLRTVQGRVKCTAAVGRLEIKTDRDFSAIERDRLMRAITELMEGLS